MDQRLTAKQELILNCIKQSIRTKGYPPSVRELCVASGLSSTSSIHNHLSTLEKKGYIKRDSSKPRTIEVVGDEINWLQNHATAVPVVGDVAAGQPILAVENIQSYFPLPSQLTKYEDTFILNVHGNSMINVGIYDGDQIIVRKQEAADNGDFVVALIEDSVTVKTYYNEGNQIRLQPENDTMSPIYCKEVRILGKVIGLVRLY